VVDKVALGEVFQPLLRFSPVNIITAMSPCRGADKSLARPGRKQATATEDFDVHKSYL
jgi:hypothetical protein